MLHMRAARDVATYSTQEDRQHPLINAPQGLPAYVSIRQHTSAEEREHALLSAPQGLQRLQREAAQVRLIQIVRRYRDNEAKKRERDRETERDERQKGSQQQLQAPTSVLQTKNKPLFYKLN